MVSDILGALGTGCLVIGSNLSMLHSNAAASDILLHDRPANSSIEFSDLPQHLGSLAFSTIKDGKPVPPFKHQFESYPDRWFRISILPFVTQAPVKSNAALFVLEDITEQERALRLEVETSNLRLVKSMAEHLAHEIGNSLVPLSTHQQLLKDSIEDPEFQESLSSALATGVKRISRLANQMVFLAREWTKDFSETVQVSDLIVEAFHEANMYNPGKKVAQLAFSNKLAPWKVSGDPKALRHAFSEIILNALQANPDDPSVSVQLEESASGDPVLKVEVRDSGKGFSREAAARGAEPFYSTRNVGLGLGLTVTRRIIESHSGSFEIPTGETGGIVRISLPAQS
jgi:signal transduction histidine kinase